MTSREKAELFGSILWFLMDGFWMMDWMLPAKICFGLVFIIVLWYHIPPLALRRIRLPWIAK
jgi:hypothetical protein